MASTAPAYSLAAGLGLVVAVPGVGVHAPAVLLLAWLANALIAQAYRRLNAEEPDCGTSFAWTARALGPVPGWLAGWAIVVADVVVMANLAEVCGRYGLALVGVDDPSAFAVTALGVAFIVAMTGVCLVGIALNARTQRVLLGVELATLAVFAGVALARAGGQRPPGAPAPSLEWLNPLGIGGGATGLTEGLLVAIFLYWGWDTAVAVNEETRDPRRAPGRSALAATGVLLVVYVGVAVAALAFAGPGRLAADASGDVFGALADDVLGGGALGKLVVIAVLSSAAASTQTTILPTARTALSMARAGAGPAALGRVHPRWRTPHVATALMGAVSIAWYVGLTLVSADVLADSVTALGLTIAFYYALTGLTCAVRFAGGTRRRPRALVGDVLLPGLGGLIFAGMLVRSCVDLAADDAGTGAVLGVGTPLVIGVALGTLGLVLMAAWRMVGGGGYFQREDGRREEPAPRTSVP